MISVSPPGQEERKARESNPHDLAVARFSGAARQPVSGCIPLRNGPGGSRTRITSTPGWRRPVGPQARSVRGVGVEPTLSGSQGRRMAAFLPPEFSGPPGNRTPISALRRRRLPVGRAAQERSGRGSNPVFRAYQGGVRPQHFQTFELRRPDSHRRRAAYETVLELLQSTPQSAAPPAGLEPTPTG